MNRLNADMTIDCPGQCGNALDYGALKSDEPFTTICDVCGSIMEFRGLPPVVLRYDKLITVFMKANYTLQESMDITMHVMNKETGPLSYFSLIELFADSIYELDLKFKPSDSIAQDYVLLR